MERITEINHIDDKTKEGQYLMAALAILTTEGDRRSKTPFDVLDELTALRNHIYCKACKIENGYEPVKQMPEHTCNKGPKLARPAIKIDNSHNA